MKKTESQIRNILRMRYPAPEYAFFGGVRNGTGYTRTTRTADALAMSLWPSRGLVLHGFEIKSDRRDWLREKKDPEKAEEIASRCDFWWIVADVGVVERSELPAAWGLLEAHGEKVKVIVEATRLEQPNDIGRSFLAAILRRAQEESPGALEIREAVEAARNEMHQKQNDRYEEDRKRKLAEENETLRELQNQVRIFEEASGFSISRGWILPKMGQAVRMIIDGGFGGFSETLRREADKMELEAARRRAIADELAPIPARVLSE